MPGPEPYITIFHFSRSSSGSICFLSLPSISLYFLVSSIFIPMDITVGWQPSNLAPHTARSLSASVMPPVPEVSRARWQPHSKPNGPWSRRSFICLLAFSLQDLQTRSLFRTMALRHNSVYAIQRKKKHIIRVVHPTCETRCRGPDTSSAYRNTRTDMHHGLRAFVTEDPRPAGLIVSNVLHRRMGRVVSGSAFCRHVNGRQIRLKLVLL